MTAPTLLSVGAAVLSAGLGLFVLAWGSRTTANRAFTAGMLVLAVQELLSGWGAGALTAPEALKWHRLQWMVGSLVPGLWLLFSLTYARANYREFIKKWRWALLGAFAIPLFLVSVWGDFLFTAALLDESSRWVLPLGWAGYALFVFFLLSVVLILVNLESTLKASTGTIRWQIKFLVLGVGVFFATQIYTASQAILFSSVNTALSPINAVALLIANALMAVSFWRSRLIKVDVYLSETFLFNSLTILLVGAYLLAVGGLARLTGLLGGTESLTLTAFLAFLALLVLAIVLLSGEARQKFKRFVNRHLKRPTYDYRGVWSTFTERTSSLVDSRVLCAAMAKMISETFGVASVSIWLFRRAKDELQLGGSTAISEAQGQGFLAGEVGRQLLIQAIQSQQTPVDLEKGVASRPVGPDELEFLREAQIHYGVPLVSAGESLGIMTVSDRVTEEAFSVEDFDLMKTIADQAAATLLNQRLSEQLLVAKEMEAFQTLSAFFVHDLKNLASRLSLTMQNLPDHYDDPAFRKDLLKVISQSVQKIDVMCRRLSPLSKELAIQRRETDVNELVADALTSLNGSLKVRLVRDLRPVPKLRIDPEEIQKVLTNLLLNADEASEDQAEVRVATSERGGWTVISVSDEGYGMSKEFIAQSLFKPFHTTKKQGLGIGLFHSKKIVEAHDGRIEVRSVPGEGSVFRVVLPSGKA